MAGVLPLTSLSLSFTGAHHSRATAFSRTCSLQSIVFFRQTVYDFIISLYKDLYTASFLAKRFSRVSCSSLRLGLDLRCL